MKLNLSLLIFIFFLLSLTTSATSPVTINLQKDTVSWKEPVFTYGQANYSNGTAVANANVKVSVGSTICNTTTNTTGFYNCSYTTPLELGTYKVSVNVTKDNDVFLNSTDLFVKITFGKKPSFIRVVLELPIIIQDFTGRLRIAILRLFLGI